VSKETSETGARERFDSLVPWARRLYAEGKSSGDVMRAIYEVDLPAEAYAFWRAFDGGQLDLPVDRMLHPWELIAVENPSQTNEAGPWDREQEERAFAQVPRFLPLMKLAADEPLYDDYIIGYDVDELRAGRTTIFGHHDDFPESGAMLDRLGDSLLGVLHEWMADHLRMLTEQFKAPSNRGFGSISQDDLDEVIEKVHAIEAVQREVVGR
jgi:hypothetical protein